MPINGCHKGKRAAVKVAAIFKEAFNDPLFDRTKDGVPGPDIRVPDWFGYAIEVKDDAALRLLHIFRPTKLLKTYWTQAELQADSLDKLPLLVCKLESLWFACDEWSQWALLDDWIAKYKDNQDSRLFRRIDFGNHGKSSDDGAAIQRAGS